MRPAVTIGDWDLDPVAGQIRRGEELRRLRPKAMSVLMCLAETPGEVVSRDDIITQVWGRQLVTDEPLTTCIAELRRTLDDQATNPLYIKTVPKRGYCLVAQVSQVDSEADSSSVDSGGASPEEVSAAPGTTSRYGVIYRVCLAAMLLAALVIGVYLWRSSTRPPAPVSELPASVVAPTEGTVPTIAVLPFINMSPEAQLDYLGEGLAEEILNSLTRVDGLRVRSRTSSFALKDEHLGASEIAQRLGVSHLLDGSIRQSGDTLRISAQLIDLRTDTSIWSEIFEQPAANVFELQGKIAASVSEALEIVLDLQQQKRLGDVGTTNPEAYQLYLRGRQFLARRTTVSISSAMKSFEQALNLDPEYAQAYLGLADANLLLPLYNNRPGADYLEKSLQAVRTALRLDPDLGEAYATLGSVLDEKRDFTGAEQAFQTALARAPRYPTTYHWYGFLLYRLARQEEADDMFELAIEQDPLSTTVQYGMSANLVAMGRFDEAEAIYREIISTDPEFAWVYEGMGELYWTGRGQLDEAARWYELAFRYDPDSSYFASRLGGIYLDAGDVDKALHWIDTAFQVETEAFSALIHQALLHRYQGEEEAAYGLALEVLEDAPANYLALTLARNHELAAGQAERARARYAVEFPELMMEKPQVDAVNFQIAVDLVPVLRQLGEPEAAEQLLALSWEIARDYPRHGLPYRLTDVKILALQGKDQAALIRLEQAIDSGWRPYWWFFMNHDPALDSIREEAAFERLVARLRLEGREAMQSDP